MTTNHDFDKQVFINCPFDKEFLPLLRAIIFTVSSLGFKPRLSLEESDGGILRLNKILELIRASRYSIHDLSRIKIANNNGNEKEYFRLNMPFELGLDFGCKNYSNDESFKNKKYLILGEEPYDYMKGLSDISGIDIKYHNKEIFDVIKEIRHWFLINAAIKCKSPDHIHNDYVMSYNTSFFSYFVDDLGYSEDTVYEDVPIKEQIDYLLDYFNKK